MPIVPPSAPAMTADEFLDLRPGRVGRWQLVDGEAREMVITPFTHTLMLAKFCRAIANHKHAGNAEWMALPLAGVVPHLNARHNVRLPDLSITRDGPEGEDRWLASPVAVVELLSPENHAETWDNIWACASIPSVEELLVLQVAQVGADLLRRGANGRWPRHPERLTGGDLVLDSIGLRIPLADLYGTAPRHADARP